VYPSHGARRPCSALDPAELVLRGVEVLAVDPEGGVPKPDGGLTRGLLEQRRRAQEMVMENVRSANAPRESVTRTRKENVPRVVGVPVIRPGLALSRSPGGSCPARSDHV
jgi:hypothetical protein